MRFLDPKSKRGRAFWWLRLQDLRRKRSTGYTPPSQVPQRAASTEATTSIHSGHSLTDAYTHSGPFPSDIISLGQSVFGPEWSDPDFLIRRLTIPGSPMHWRWNQGDAPGTYPWADNDVLMITEGGPPALLPADDPNDYLVSTLDYLCRFAAYQIENGRGDETILWSIWPVLDLGVNQELENYWDDWQHLTFRTALDEYGRIYRYMADFATWKLKSLYELPEDWKIWLFPGHLFMARVYDDIQAEEVPGISTIDDLFSDDIHPNNVGGYGLACFVFTMLYQIDLREVDGAYVQPPHASLDGVTQEQAEYFWRISWEIATTYRPAGLGGTGHAAPEFDPNTMPDHLPGWTLEDPSGGDPGDPDPGDGDVPVWASSYTPTDGYVGNALDVPFVIEDGLLTFESGVTNGNEASLAMSNQRYLIAAVRTGPKPETPAIVSVMSLANAGSDQGLMEVVWHTGINTFMLILRDSEPGSFEESGIPSPYEEWFIYEGWVDVDAGYLTLDGTNIQTLTPGWEADPLTDVGTSSVMWFAKNRWEGGLPAGHNFQIAAFGVHDGVPSAEARQAARAWAASHIPE